MATILTHNAADLPAPTPEFVPKLVTTLREGYGPAQLRADALAGLTVAIVEGSEENVKITTADDYFMAEAFLMPEAAENPGTNGGS